MLCSGMAAVNDPDAGGFDRITISPRDQAAVDTPSRPDLLEEVLDSVRLTAALFFAVDASSPWCVDVPEARDYARLILPRDQHVVSYHIAVNGEGWANVPGVAPQRFGPGDILFFPHGDPYVMEGGTGTPTRLDSAETQRFFRALASGELPFMVPLGGGGAPRAEFICGYLGMEARPFNPILSGLPRMLHLQRGGGGGDMLDRLVEMTIEEARQRRAGGRSVSVRLSEVLFIELLRRYAETPGPKPPGWLTGARDPKLGRALAALHADPARAWTVEALASTAGLSRSALASRFSDLIGHPPAEYLRLWRLQLASTLLRETDLQVAEIGRRVGYGAEAAFSRSFKRHLGLSPEAWRRGAPG